MGILCCHHCGSPLRKSEVAITKKLIGRNAKNYLCVSCLADYLGVPPQQIQDQIDFFRRSGCFLFR